jgi:amidophosphoribosyltransferase
MEITQLGHSKIHEECGVFGIWSKEKKDMARTVYYGLTALQHRGQESAGIAINEDRNIRYHKDLGLVHEVFDEGTLARLGEGQIAVGHVRYATTGENTALNAQPMVVRHVKGQLALCHNGNLVNAAKLRRELELSGCIFQTSSDTEVISYLITRNRLHTPSIEEALSETIGSLQGAFSLVMMSPTKLLACRDPYGLRPLCFGRTPDGDYVVASETCALDAVGATLERELAPGEILVIDADGLRSDTCHCGEKPHSLCVFEYIYFARSDSVIDGISVQAARKKAGMLLSKEHPVEADVVIGVPDSGLDAALGYAESSGIPYGIGLIKNKYIGRTFIEPGQEHRENLVRLKLNAVSGALRDKRVIMIDDSIVRGTTSGRIVDLIRRAGAREVHVRISAPPFLNPCYYGTDIPSREKLIAYHHSTEEICRMIGADSLGFLSVESALQLASPKMPSELCAACFDGRYPAGEPEDYAALAKSI